MDLHNFMYMDKLNITIAHVGLLQVWAYEKIVMIHLVGIHRDREDLKNINMTY